MKPPFHVLPMLASLGLFAQAVPSTLNYQGRLTDNTPAQAPVTATVQMQFALYDAASGGTRLWQEPTADNTGVSVTVNGGIFNYLLGGSVPVPAGLFSGASTVRYLQITLDPAGTPEVLAPRQLISAAAYANLAQSANSATTAATATTATNSTQLGGVVASGYLLSGGTAFDSARLGGTLASGWQRALGTPACPADQYLTTINANGTAVCAPAAVTEADPKVGTLSDGRIPRWNGTSLADGTLVDTGSRVGLGTSSPLAPLHVALQAPVQVGSFTYPLGVTTRALAIHGNYLYAASSSAVTVIDISAPAAPFEFSAFSTTQVEDVSVAGNYMYLAKNSASEAMQIVDRGYHDFSDPAGTFSGSAGNTGIRVRGRYAYMTNSADGNLVVVDVGNPAQPLLAGSVSAGAGPSDLFVSGRYAYVTLRNGNLLKIFDIASPSSPWERGQVATGSLPVAVEVHGNYAYVLDSAGLKIVNISNSMFPSVVGSLAIGAAAAIQVQGRIAYIANRSTYELQLVDVGNPAAPVLLYSQYTGNPPEDLVVRGRFAYVLTQGALFSPSTLQTYDLGGAHIERLETAGLSTNSLSIRDEARFDSDVQVLGGLSVGVGGVNSGGVITSSAGFSGPGTGLTGVAQLSGNQSFSGTNNFTGPGNSFFGTFQGDGSAVWDLNASALASGTLPDGRLSGTYTGALTFNNPSNSFWGSGAGLTALNAGSLGSGTIPDGRLSGTYSGALTFSNALNSFTGSGAGLTALNAGNLATGTLPSGRLSGTYTGALTFNNALNSFTGSGAGLTALNAGNLGSGTIPDGRLSGTYSGALTFSNALNSFTGSGAGLTALNAGNLGSGTVPDGRLSGTYSGAITLSNASNNFNGSGAGLTALNADNISSGTLLSGRLSGIYVNALTFSNASNSFTGSGGGLTALNADNISTGTLSSGRLNGTYAGALTFSNALNSFTGSGAGLTSLNASNVASGNLAATRMPTGGSWSLTSDLSVDANTLVVDQLNNRVGIGTAGPAAALDVTGDARVSGKLSTAANLGNTAVPAIGDRYRDNGVIAWAKVAATGALSFDYGIASVTKPVVGTYTFTLDNSASSSFQLIPTANPELAAPPANAASLRIATVNQLTVNTFSVYISDGNGAPVDNAFVVIVTGR